MYTLLIIGVATAYVGLLFWVAWRVGRFSDKGRRIVNNPYVYSLSLAVYCTAWTFFGSVGRAASGGLNFLAVYLGPLLMIMLWWSLLRKMALISKHQRIASVADFISSRFGKSSWIASVVTLMAIVGVIPYISIQLRAVSGSIAVLRGVAEPGVDFGWLTALAMAAFTIWFGARKVDPNEQHEGMIAAIALESIVKLGAFLTVGLFVVYHFHGGFGDLFEQAYAREDLRSLFSLRSSGVGAFDWHMLLLISALAIVFLPRQFHVAVVENNNPNHIRQAMWLFPLYLLLINLFVFPVALCGRINLAPEAVYDNYMLTLPIAAGSPAMALLAFLGGFSAATSMVIVSTTALSIMTGNHLVVPMFIHWRRWRGLSQTQGAIDLLSVRRWSILFILLLAWAYASLVGERYDLVSVGLVSFTAVAQFAPSAVLGMYWRRLTRYGAITGMIAGFVVWIYTLPFFTLTTFMFGDQAWLEQGPWGISWLRPMALFGLEGVSPIAHAAFWSLFFNLFFLVGVSLLTRPSALGMVQSDLFVNIYRYSKGQDVEVLRRTASIRDLRGLAQRFMGEEREAELHAKYEALNPGRLDGSDIAPISYIAFIETHLAGSIGSASARLAISAIATEEAVNREEIISALEQTREALAYSKALELKSAELEEAARQLRDANEQLKVLDTLKAEFITTVTHELRTPVTSIKALSQIILDHRDEIPPDQMREYLQIIVNESGRLGRLINQVLDLERLESQRGQDSLKFERVNWPKLCAETLQTMAHNFEAKRIVVLPDISEVELFVMADRDALVQAMVNLFPMRSNLRPRLRAV